MTSAAVFVFSFANSDEKQQLAELRQYYAEKGIQLNKSGPADLFENLSELIDAAGPLVGGLQNEKEVELLLNSLFSLLIYFSGDQAHKLVNQFCSLLTGQQPHQQAASPTFRGRGWNSTAGVAVRVLYNLYHLHANNPVLQLIVLQHLLSAAGRAHLTQQVDIASGERIDELAQRWNLTIEQRRELYRRLHAALVQDERHETAAEVMCTLLKTYTEEDAPKAQADARECVRTTIIDPRSFCFDHLLHLSAVKSLEKTDPLIYEMLCIFVYGSLTEYRRFIGAHPTFVRDQLRVEDERGLETKIKQLTLISLAEKRQNIPLHELATELDIADAEELEEFLIDSIHANAIQGKINEVDGMLAISFYQHRVFGPSQWEQLHGRLVNMLENVRWFRENMRPVVAGNEGLVEG